jgi:hypothetical protein
MRNSKPIRVFYSILSQRFYASRAYKEVQPGVVEITGDKFDVTDDIAAMVIKHDIEFSSLAPHTVEKPEGEEEA